MAICQKEERAAGRPYPRTCPTCKLGPCSRSAMTTDSRDALPPRLDPTCTCICHTQPGVVHFAPCCRETDPKDDEIARLTAALAEAEAAEEGALMILVQTQAERDAALAQVARLQHLIREASDPDFLWGAMDNVNDMDADITEFANAASRAIRASIPILAAAEKEKGNG